MTDGRRALAEQVAGDHARGAFSRREAIRRLGVIGLTGAAATGLTDVLTPAPAAAQAGTTAAPKLDDESEIQGNILRAFGGQHHAYLFVSFGNNRAQARTWLTTAAGRVDTTADVAAARTSGAAMMGLGLTATGLVTLHPEVAADLVPYEAFWLGPLGNRLDDAGRLTTTPTLLGDVGAAHPAKWVVGGPGRAPVDALLTLAADDETTLEQRVQRERQALTGAGLTVLHEQRGAVVRTASGQRAEHFGFADGIAQPTVRGAHGTPEDIAPGEFLLGFTGERRPMNLGHRPATAAWMWGGSFQVFRRLRQDVAGWWAKMNQLRENGQTAEDVAARAMGRKLDGTPLGLDFDKDPEGKTTPLYAHVRKMNPRDDTVFRDRSHRILRRGIPYGPAMDRSAPDSQDRGMLFNAYMASIEDQFEFLQRRWANDPSVASSTLTKSGKKAGPDGFDPVIGDDPAVAAKRFGADAVKKVPSAAFGGFVTTTGSVYAFTPTRAALRLLSTDSSL
ncbi:peroxidase [Actinoplanes cyaneus]|uniref:Peroxidase n=1 Tax=Actinoplanes cyaneus TaxID=52696 RepID=A0A919IRM4_9ACTN|nr:Dyp-type peroxidase [Actinoplanes cyaneus]MCW2143607.1 Dyp-type peroxidase family [Actinoplanes cyaneus]GID69761.1 peroxidase [Actinoplanes cyaneus]